VISTPLPTSGPGGPVCVGSEGGRYLSTVLDGESSGKRRMGSTRFRVAPV
jgi:hypothetical protein